MAEKSANPDWAVSRVAARQHGVVSIHQLHEAGLSDDAVLGRVRTGRLHRLHRGVFAVGHPEPPIEGRWMAAVLACGDRAVLSHISAAALWRLLDPRGGPIHVAVPGDGGKRKQRGIRIHRLVTLHPDQMTRKRRIPVTTPARTIMDLRRLRPPVSEATHRRAVRQAEVLGLRTGLGEAVAPTRSELEDCFLALCHRHRLPLPEVNVRVGRWEADFLWREQRLVVETDGYRFHRGPTAFETDHVRDLDLRISGHDVLHFTYDQVTNHPSQVANVLHRELEAHRNASSLTS